MFTDRYGQYIYKKFLTDVLREGYHNVGAVKVGCTGAFA